MRGSDLVARLRLDSAPFDRTLQQARSDLQSVAKVTSAVPGRNIFSGLAADAATLTPALSSMPLAIAAVGTALTGAALSARRAGVEFEASLAKIRTLGPEAQRTLGETRQAILDTFSSVPVRGGITDLAEANYLLQSSGRSAEDAVTDLRIAAEASVAGYTSVTTAVDGLTTVTNAWKDSQITTAQASDALFSAVNFGKSTFEEIAQSIGLVAPLAASAGVRFEEVAAATAVLSNQGLRTSSIMEGLRSAILNIQRPTENFKKEYAGLAREFDASRLSRDGLLTFLKDFQKETGGAREPLNALFTDATGLLAVLGLLKNDGKDAADALKTVKQSAGETREALAELKKEASFQEQLVRNQLSAVWTDFGTLLSRNTLPILERVARMMNVIAEGRGTAKGAIFAATDVDRFIEDDRTGLSGTPAARQGRLENVLRTFRRRPDAFLKELTDDQIRALRTKLLEEQDFNLEDRIPVELIRRLDQTLRVRDTAARSRARVAAADARLARVQPATSTPSPDSTSTSDTRLARTIATQDTKLQQQEDKLLSDAIAFAEALQAKTLEALQGTAGVLQRQLQEVIEQAEKYLKTGTLPAEDAAFVKSQLAGFKKVQAELIAVGEEATRTDEALTRALSQEEIPALRTIGDRERELTVILAGTKGLEARKQIEEQLAKLAAARGERTDSLFGTGSSEAIDDRIQQMGDLAQQIATVGDALGILPERAVAALRGIGGLVEQGSKLQAAFKSNSGVGALGKLGLSIGVVAGIASLAAGVLGKSPEEQQQREELRQNTAALRKLSDNVGDLASSPVTGSAFSGTRRGLAAVLAENDGGYPGTNILRQFGGDNVTGLTGLIANRGGITVSQVEEAIKASGLVLNESTTSIRQLLDYFSRADTAAYVDSFAGSLQLLDDTLRADGVTDAFEIFRRRVALFTDPVKGFPALAQAVEGFDLSTVEGRTGASARARTLFDDVVNGRVPIEQFGRLSVGEGKQAVLDFISSVFDINQGGASGTGGFNETRSITEVTGSRLAGLLGTANTYLATIAADIATLRVGLVGGPLPTLSPPRLDRLGGAVAAGGVMVSGVTINVSVTLTRELLGADAGRSLERGTSMGRAIGDGVIEQIDQQLRDRELRQRLVTGDATIRR